MIRVLQDSRQVELDERAEMFGKVLNYEYADSAGWRGTVIQLDGAIEPQTLF